LDIIEILLDPVCFVDVFGCTGLAIHLTSKAGVYRGGVKNVKAGKYAREKRTRPSSRLIRVAIISPDNRTVGHVRRDHLDTGIRHAFIFRVRARHQRLDNRHFGIGP
jgi:hypothetical protein